MQFSSKINTERLTIFSGEMSDFTAPPEKRSRLDYDGSHSFDEILELFSNEIQKGPKRLVSVKPEKIDHTLNESQDEGQETVRTNLLSQLDSLKTLFSSILSQKESDYIQLDLEHSATLEMLEEHRASNEEAKRELEKNRREMSQSKQKLSNVEEQLENVKTELDQAKSLIELKNEKLTRAETVLKEYVPIANRNKEKISKLEKELKQAKLELKEKSEKLNKCEPILRETAAKIQMAKISEDELKMMKQKNQALIEMLKKKEIEKGDQGQTLLRENVLMKTTIRAREAEIEKLKQKAEKSKKNFFVLNNDETNDLSVQLSDKCDEVKRLNEENAEMISVLNTKEIEIKDIKSKIIQSETMIQKLNCDNSKLKVEFKKHFHDLNRKVELHIKSKQLSPLENQSKTYSDKSEPLSKEVSPSLNVPGPVTQLYPNIDVFNKISSLKDLNIQSNMAPALGAFTSTTHPSEPSLQTSPLMGPLPDLVS